MKHILTFGLLITSIFSLFFLIRTDVANTSELDMALSNAKKYEEEELYIKAIEHYRAAVSLSEDNYSYKLAIIENYEKLQDMENAVFLTETLVSTDPDRVEAYLRLLEYYKAEEEYSKFVPLVFAAAERFAGNEQIAACQNELESMYAINSAGYNDITPYYNGQAIAYSDTIDEENPKESIVLDQQGALVGEPMNYKEVRFTDVQNQFLIKTKEDEWQIIDEQAYPIAKCKETQIENMTEMMEGCASAKAGEKFVLFNDKLAQSKMSWDFAGTFSNGIAPVRLGDKWGLMARDSISADSQACQYEDIIMDEFGRCCMNDRIFVKQQGQYFLIDSSGERITNSGFEDAKVFVSNQPAAVKQQGKWGYISAEGEMIINPQFEEAQSFCNGYAAIRQGEKWGVINAKGDVVVEPQFLQVKNASEKGVIPVRDESGYWNMLRMFKLFYYNS